MALTGREGGCDWLRETRTLLDLLSAKFSKSSKCLSYNRKHTLKGGGGKGEGRDKIQQHTFQTISNVTWLQVKECTCIPIVRMENGGGTYFENHSRMVLDILREVLLPFAPRCSLRRVDRARHRGALGCFLEAPCLPRYFPWRCVPLARFDGRFDNFLRNVARRAFAFGTSSASLSTLVRFFRQWLSVALHCVHAMNTVARRKGGKAGRAASRPCGKRRRWTPSRPRGRWHSLAG